MNLTRALIVDSAMEILDSFGLGDMTMRRVATKLGVAPGALYWHIANKQQLLSAIAEEILAPVTEIHTDLQGDREPREYCLVLRSALLSHRDGSEVVASALAQPDAPLGSELEARFAHVMSRLTRDPAMARTGARAIIHLLLGACVQEQSRQQFTELAGQSDTATMGTSDIDSQVELLLAGIAAANH